MVSAPDPRRAALEQKFRSTAEERLSRLFADLAIYEETPDDVSVLDRMARELHTMKGEARMLGLGVVNDVCHVVEDVVQAMRGGAAGADMLARGFDVVSVLLREPGFMPGQFQSEIDAFRSDAVAHLHAVAPQVRAPVTAQPSRPSSVGRMTTARIAIDQLDQLTSVTAGLMLRHAEQARHVADLRRLVGDLRDAADRILIGPHTTTFHALAKEMEATLTRLVDKGLENRVGLRTLQDDVQALRLLPLRLLFDAAPSSVRELARQSNKQVRIVVEGADVAVDKQVLDVLDPALVHLIRNAVDHGIEAPQERVDKGKPAQGTIVLSARQVGGIVDVEVRDDGRGIDIDALRAAAVRLSRLSPADAAEADLSTLMPLVFEGGFTTRTEVSDLSGRGFGLDVVKREVEALGGAVRIAALDVGTAITITVPTSAALARVLVCGVAEGTYSFPSSAVDRVMLLERDKLEIAGSARCIRIADARVPVHDLAALLGFARDDDRDAERLVVLEREGERVALQVARVIGEKQAVMRPLDAIVGGVSLIAASSIIDGGNLVLGVNVAELFEAARRTQAGTASAPATAPKVAPKKPRVLIVDDSELTRDMLVHLAARIGVEPWEAIDGHDAISLLDKRRPDLVLTDLDMPVCDGIALIEHIRRTPALKALPVIVLSTRGATEDKRRAMEAGANAYLVKSAFQAEELRKLLAVYLPAF